MRRRALAVVAALLVAWTGAAWAQAAPRPSEQDIFGGAQPAPAQPAPAQPAPAPPAPATPPRRARVATPGANTPASEPPPAAAAASEALDIERDQAVLGNTGGQVQHLSDYQAPENPLQIGGQIYLRTQATALQGAAPDGWSLNAPSLLDAYFDARPNPRVRAFVLGRMSYNPTAAPSGAAETTANGLPVGSQGAFSGGSPTGFTTFSAARGPTSVLDQMWMRFDIAQRVFVTAGKQHVRWGTGRFWQPTDYLHLLRRNPLDVFDARAGTSMLKLHMPWEQRGWNFYAFGVFEDPNLATNNLRPGRGRGARRDRHRGRRDRPGRVRQTRSEAALRHRLLRLASGTSTSMPTSASARARTSGPSCELSPDPNQQLTCDPNVADPTDVPIATDPLASHYALQTLSGIKTQAVGGINYSRKYNDNDLFLIGAEYFYNQPGIRGPESLSRPAVQHVEHADAELLLHRPALRRAVHVAPGAVFVELHDLHAVDARRTFQTCRSCRASTTRSRCSPTSRWRRSSASTTARAGASSVPASTFPARP